MVIWGGALLTTLYCITSLGLVYIFCVFNFPSVFLLANFHQMTNFNFFSKDGKRKKKFGFFLDAKFVNEN
jgi:hypothetical protein